MKIFEVKDWDLQHQAEQRTGRKFNIIPTPAERAIHLLLAALDTVNQAGLDGKKLTEITVVQKPDIGRDGGSIEIHAKVEHRLTSHK
jgi:hypothetical protein